MATSKESNTPTKASGPQKVKLQYIGGMDEVRLVLVSGMSCSVKRGESFDFLAMDAKALETNSEWVTPSKAKTSQTPKIKDTSEDKTSESIGSDHKERA